MSENQFEEIQIKKNLQEWKDRSDAFEKESGISQREMIDDIKKLSKKEQMELARKMVGL